MLKAPRAKLSRNSRASTSVPADVRHHQDPGPAAKVLRQKLPSRVQQKRLTFSGAAVSEFCAKEWKNSTHLPSLMLSAGLIAPADGSELSEDPTVDKNAFYGFPDVSAARFSLSCSLFCSFSPRQHFWD